MLPAQHSTACTALHGSMHGQSSSLSAAVSCRGEAGTHRGQGHVLLESLGHRGGSLRGVTGEYLYLIHYHTCIRQVNPEQTFVQARQAALSATFQSCMQFQPETHTTATVCLDHCKDAVFELG